jgi:hypothetical protein
MMTNATIAEIAAVGEDRELELAWAEGERRSVFVPFDAPIVRIEQTGTRAMLTPGRAVFLMVEGSKAGPLAVAAVAAVVGEGVDPPM